MAVTDRIGDIVWLAILSLVAFNIGGFIYNYFNPQSTIQTGISIYLFSLGLIVFAITNLLRKGASFTKLDKQDWIVTILVFIVAIGISLVAPKIAPSIFSVAVTQLQSVVGI